MSEENKPVNNEEEVKPPTNEQQLNNPSTGEAIVPAAEIIPESERPSTLNLQPLNPAMEVHHHTHASHGKKNWKSYFWEFLMLFLAVFCGFLAEYQLEQTIERHKEKDYIKNFAEDLQTDLREIARVLPSSKEKALRLDSLNYGLYNSHFNTADLYYYARLSTRTVSFLPSDRTIIQLKNSGGFRLITNKQSADSILAYQGAIERYQFALMRENQDVQHLLPYLSKLFNAAVFNAMVDTANQIHMPIGNPPMRSSDPDLINEFSYYVHLLKTTTLLKNNSLHAIHKRATNTLEFLRKTYHLENE